MIKVISPSYNKEIENFSLETSQFHDKFKVFLAGTIDNGESDDWQSNLIWQMKTKHHGPNSDIDESIGDIVVFNPRRSNWGSNASIADVEEQIKWEQQHLDEADLIIMNFVDGSKSPITLLELGLYGPEGKTIVFCTDKFYRFTDVKLTCDKYMIPLIKSTKEEDICNEIERIYNEACMLSEMNELEVDEYKHQ